MKIAVAAVVVVAIVAALARVRDARLVRGEKRLALSVNKQVIEEYLAAFRESDHARVLATLTEDVEWVIPGAFHKKGKPAFDAEIENPAFECRPDIRHERLTQEGDVVVCEGRVKTKKKGGPELWLAFCDVFELRGGKIAKLTSYFMPLGQP